MNALELKEQLKNLPPKRTCQLKTENFPSSWLEWQLRALAGIFCGLGVDSAEIGEPRQVCRLLQLSQRANHQGGEAVAAPARPAKYGRRCSTLLAKRRAPAWKWKLEIKYQQT